MEKEINDWMNIMLLHFDSVNCDFSCYFIYKYIIFLPFILFHTIALTYNMLRFILSLLEVI